MNPTLYTQLSDLGFGEWLRKKDSLFWAALKKIDESDIDNLFRTMLNALAFRWLREDKRINISINLFKDHSADNNDPYEYRYLIFKGRYTYYKDNPTHPLAEHEALNKALEILSKGGENV